MARESDGQLSSWAKNKKSGVTNTSDPGLPFNFKRLGYEVFVIDRDSMS